MLQIKKHGGDNPESDDVDYYDPELFPYRWYYNNPSHSEECGGDFNDYWCDYASVGPGFYLEARFSQGDEKQNFRKYNRGPGKGARCHASHRVGGWGDLGTDLSLPECAEKCVHSSTCKYFSYQSTGKNQCTSFEACDKVQKIKDHVIYAKRTWEPWYNYYNPAKGQSDEHLGPKDDDDYYFNQETPSPTEETPSPTKVTNTLVQKMTMTTTSIRRHLRQPKRH